MADEVNQQTGGKSLLAQIKAEADKAKRESAKSQLKSLYADYNKAAEVLEGIEQKIIDVIRSVGEDEAAVKALLASE